MYIKVKITPKSKKESFEQAGKDTFKISVKEPAERNLANTRIIELVAIHFGVPAKRVRIIIGHHSPSKILNVDIE